MSRLFVLVLVLEVTIDRRRVPPCRLNAITDTRTNTNSRPIAHFFAGAIDRLNRCVL